MSSVRRVPLLSTLAGAGALLCAAGGCHSTPAPADMGTGFDVQLTVTGLPVGVTQWSPQIFIDGNQRAIDPVARLAAGKTDDTGTFHLTRPIAGSWQIKVALQGVAPPCMQYSQTYPSSPDMFDVAEDGTGLGGHQGLPFANSQVDSIRATQSVWLRLNLSGRGMVRVSDPGGSDLIAGSGAQVENSVPCGVQLTLAAQPADTTRFDSFSAPCGGADPCTASFNSSTTMQVNFSDKKCASGYCVETADALGAGGWNGIFGFSSSEVLVVGSGGHIASWNGLVWTAEAPMVGQDLYGIWGYQTGEQRTVWVVGANRLLLMGTKPGKTAPWTWAGQPIQDGVSGLNYNLYSVWGRLPAVNEVVAVGGDGNARAVRWTGPGQATSVPIDQTQSLTARGVWGGAGGYVVAGSLSTVVGGAYRSLDGGKSWASIGQAGLPPFSAVTSTGESFWVVGDTGMAGMAGAVWRWRPNVGWDQQPAAPGALRGIWSSGTAVWAVGDGAGVISQDASTGAGAWSQLGLSGLAGGGFRGVWSDGVGRVWVAGDAVLSSHL